MDNNTVIANLQTRIIEKNGLLASCWVQLSSGVSFKVLVLSSKQDGRPYIQLPSERYVDNTGQQRNRRILSLTDTLYNLVQQACILSYQNEKNKQRQPVTEPVLATPTPASQTNQIPTQPQATIPTTTDPQQAVEQAFNGTADSSANDSADPNDILDDVIGQDIAEIMGE